MKIKLDLYSKKKLLITYHPETLSNDLGISGLDNLLKALLNFECNILFTSPNADKGSDIILDKIQNFVDKNKNNYFFVPSLGQTLYLNALLLFDCIIGNSSSGINEACLLKKALLISEIVKREDTNLGKLLMLKVIINLFQVPFIKYLNCQREIRLI